MTYRKFLILISLLLALSDRAIAYEQDKKPSPTIFAAQHGIEWPMLLMPPSIQKTKLTRYLNNNVQWLYNHEGFNKTECESLKSALMDGQATFRAPSYRATNIPDLKKAAGVMHCPENNPLLNLGREWTILTQYYDEVVAIPDWRNWPTDKATVYQAQFNLSLYNPYPEQPNNAETRKGTNLLFFAEGICRPSDSYVCLSPRYKLFDPKNCKFHHNFMVDARYTPGDKTQKLSQNGIVEINGNVFIYDLTSPSHPETEGKLKMGRFNLREIHEPDGSPSHRRCQFGTADYVTFWERYH